jgi:hypothetical protein
MFQPMGVLESGRVICKRDNPGNLIRIGTRRWKAIHTKASTQHTLPDGRHDSPDVPH